MTQPSNKLSQFWQELKRRKVIKVIAMYAGASFIIMEAAEIIIYLFGKWTRPLLCDDHKHYNVDIH